MKTELLSLAIKIFADSADLKTLRHFSRLPFIKGFTTNPTLLAQSGIKRYTFFAREILSALPSYPICFEVFADTLPEMEAQARTISKWGPSVYVKIPVTTTQGEWTLPVVEKLSAEGIKINVTAISTREQVRNTARAFSPSTPGMMSLLVGRIADSGRDPIPFVKQSADICRSASSQLELLWASPREVLNVFQANESGCHLITLTAPLIEKLEGVGKPLDLLSLETIQQFRRDAVRSRLEL